MRPAAQSTGLYGAFGLAWYLTVIAPTVTAKLATWWGSAYLATPAEIPGTLTAVIDGLVPFGGVVGLILAGAALAIIVWRSRPLSLLLAGPVVVALVLAALELMPLGGGRIDMFLYPGLAILLGLAVDEVARWIPA